MGLRDWFGRMFGSAEHAAVEPWHYMEERMRGLRHPHHASPFFHGSRPSFGAGSAPGTPGAHPGAAPHPGMMIRG